MNPAQSLSNITIRPIELNSNSMNSSQNWMNSPKSQNHIKIFRQTSLFQPGPNISTNQHKPEQQSINKSIAITNQRNNALQNQSLSMSSMNFILMSPANKEMNSNNYLTPNRDNNNTSKISQNFHPNILNEYDQMQNKLDGIQDRLNIIKEKMKKKKEQKLSKVMNEQWKTVNKTVKSKSKSKQKNKGKSKQKVKKTQQDSQALKQLVSQVNCNKNLKTINFDPYTPKSHHVYYVSQILRTYKQENSLARDHLMNSLQQLKVLSKLRGLSQELIQKKQMRLQRKNIYQGRKTVIFDLDETLIHCNQNSNMPCDIKLNIKFPTGQNIVAGINVRPHAVQILKNLSKTFQIIIFTASHSSYANQVINYLDPNNEYVSHRLFRQHCYQTPEGVYIKDLRIINRDLTQTVLIDNAAYSYALQVENGIPIIPFYQGKMDFELRALQKYIQSLLFCKDVRDMNRNTFMLNKYHQFDHPDALVKSLYGDIHD